ncbi:MAG: ABC transporter permease [Gemmatimonadaceae bacterium]|nr:ABC transporter permease [Gemmatimonadaceae bacterium]
MLWKEFIQLRRDRFTLGMVVGVPAIQIALFGFAIRTEVRHLPLLVLDESRTSQSRALVQAMVNTRNFDLQGHVTDREDVRRAIERGDAQAALVIPPSFATDLKRRRTATAQMIVDAADPMASSAAIGAAAQAGAVVAGVLGSPGVVPLEVRVRPWYNPALESAVYIVPGVTGVLLTMTLILINGLAIVRERERGTLEQLVVTPISRTGLMLGKLFPFALVGYVQMTVVLLIGSLAFDVPMRGSVGLLYLMALPFIIASLGIGLLISTLVRTQAQALQLAFLVLLPTILLSGFMFPRQAMPAAAQWIGAAFPVTYFLRILRGILLKGAGWPALWRETLVLSVFAIVLVVLATTRFRKSVE